MKAASEPLRKQLRYACATTLEQLAGADESCLVLGEPPTAPSARVWTRAMTPLADRKGSGYRQMRTWSRQALNANGFPTLIIAVAGEAHFRIGVTQSTYRNRKKRFGLRLNLLAAIANLHV